MPKQIDPFQIDPFQIDPFQIDSFILPNDIISNMKDKIKETKKLKTEIGFSLCKNISNSNIITKGTECKGTNCSIKLPKTNLCPENQIYIGNYHTHPRSAPQMSITDMVTACDEELECIGSVPFNKIRCYTRKTDESQCTKEISPFEDEEHEILKKGEEIRSVLRDPLSIKRLGIKKFIKTLSQIYEYDKNVAKYHTNRLKLLNKHFNKIDI